LADYPVDAVISWVDGDDPEHKRRRRAALKTSGRVPGIIPAGKVASRFSDNGELLLAVKSIRKNAPWVRNILVVSDKQRPRWTNGDIERDLGLRFVDHEEIFVGYEWALPTFNSRAIETAIWRINGLADRFIYLNDDFFILKPVRKEEFFRGDKFVFRGKWKPIRLPGPMLRSIERRFNDVLKFALNISRTGSLHTQMRGAVLAGLRNRYFWSPHAPHPMRKSTLQNYFNRNPEVFEGNIGYRFRDESQFVSSFLARHLEIQNNKAILISDSDAMMIPGRFIKRSTEQWVEQIVRKSPKFLCVQSVDAMEKSEMEELLRKIGELIG
jgi:hypothetical protein